MSVLLFKGLGRSGTRFVRASTPWIAGWMTGTAVSVLTVTFLAWWPAGCTSAGRGVFALAVLGTVFKAWTAVVAQSAGDRESLFIGIALAFCGPRRESPAR